MSKAPAASACAVSASEGWETSTSFGFSGLAWAASRLSTAVVAAWVLTAADVDARRGGRRSRGRSGGAEADQDRGVDLRGEGGGAQDAREVEPLAADPDPLAGPDPVDAHQLGGCRAEHGDRLAGGGGVEEAALGDRGAGHSGQAQAGGVHAEPVGVDGGNSGLR